jgi:hypothetical protein
MKVVLTYACMAANVTGECGRHQFIRFTPPGGHATYQEWGDRGERAIEPSQRHRHLVDGHVGSGHRVMPAGAPTSPRRKVLLDSIHHTGTVIRVKQPRHHKCNLVQPSDHLHRRLAAGVTTAAAAAVAPACVLRCDPALVSRNHAARRRRLLHQPCRL